MDDLLYTFFVIAWIAYGIYKAVKKNKPQREKPISVQSASEVKNESKISSTIESIFDEVFDLSDSKNDKTDHPYERNIASKSAERADSYANHLGEDLLDSYKGSDNVNSVFRKHEEPSAITDSIDKSFDNQSEEEGVEDKNTLFDLRQAVIHQVILERPY